MLIYLLDLNNFRYTAENSVKYGVLRDTDHPELRQPLALEVWESAVKSLKPGSKITILTNGPLTNIAKIVLAGENMTNAIQASNFLYPLRKSQGGITCSRTVLI